MARRLRLQRCASRGCRGVIRALAASGGRCLARANGVRRGYKLGALEPLAMWIKRCCQRRPRQFGDPFRTLPARLAISAALRSTTRAVRRFVAELRRPLIALSPLPPQPGCRRAAQSAPSAPHLMRRRARFFAPRRLPGGTQIADPRWQGMALNVAIEIPNLLDTEQDLQIAINPAVDLPAPVGAVQVVAPSSASPSHRAQARGQVSARFDGLICRSFSVSRRSISIARRAEPFHR